MESITHGNGVNPDGNAQWEVQSISKSVPITSKMQNQKMTSCNSSSIWVGSIDSSITDFKLKEKFVK